MLVLYTRRAKLPDAHLSQSASLTVTESATGHSWTVTLAEHDGLDASSSLATRVVSRRETSFDNARDALASWKQAVGDLVATSHLAVLEGMPPAQLLRSVPSAHLRARAEALGAPVLLGGLNAPWASPTPWLADHTAALHDLLFAALPANKLRSKAWLPYLTRGKLSANEPALQLLAAWALNQQDGARRVPSLLDGLALADWRSPRSAASSAHLFDEFAAGLVRRGSTMYADVPWLQKLSEVEKFSVELSVRSFCEALCLFSS